MGYMVSCLGGSSHLLTSDFKACSVDKVEIWCKNMRVMWNCYVRTTLTAEDVKILWSYSFFLKKEENVTLLQEGVS